MLSIYANWLIERFSDFISEICFAHNASQATLPYRVKTCQFERSDSYAIMSQLRSFHKMNNRMLSFFLFPIFSFGGSKEENRNY